METHAPRPFYRPPSPTWAALLLAVIWCMGVGVGAEVGDGGVEWCGDRRGVGDKWFDGCQWCVCTLQGPLCSSSTCSGLEKQVPVCHVLGQRWTDGCYRCRCRRHGITCRMNDACHLLHLQPVPCLADKRCVCGPDGVPSCTAAVIDRNAYDARRIHLGFPHTPQEPKAVYDSHRQRHGGVGGVGVGGGHRGHHAMKHGRSSSPLYGQRQHSSYLAAGGYDLWGSRSDAEGGESGVFSARSSPSSLEGDPQSAEQQATQELLITSDNMCRFGARWYGGSLRCFCDMDGSIACGNPVFILALFDDFRIQPERCEEGHVWEDGCSVCTCEVNGVVFCQHSASCPNRHIFPHHRGDDGNDEEDNFRGGDHDLEEFSELSPEESGEGDFHDVLVPSTLSPLKRKSPTPTSVSARCMPGSRWRQGCLQCRCTRHGRQLCIPHHCQEEEEEEEVDLNLPTRVAGHRHQAQKSLPPRNHAREDPATLGPPFKRFRGPMMVAPKPAGPFRPPAYALVGPAGPAEVLSLCGPFSVGVKYWDDCNLCLCTSRGPRCQGKLCR